MSISQEELRRPQDLSWDEIVSIVKNKRLSVEPPQEDLGSFAASMSWDEIVDYLKQRDQELSQAIKEVPQLKPFSYEEIAKDVEQRTKEKQGIVTPWDVIKYALTAGVFRTAGDLWKVTELVYEGASKLTDAITDLADKNLYSPEKDVVLQTIKSLGNAAKESEERYYKKATTQNWFLEFIKEGLVATPEVITAMFLGTGVPGAAGSLAKMIPFGALAAGGHAYNIEKEFEALGKEAPYWKRLVGGLLGGTGEVATEMPVYAGISKLLKSAGILNAVNRGAEKLLNTFGEKAVEFTKDVLLEAAQEAEMEPIERAIKQTLGLPQDWSITSIARDMTDAARGGLAMALIIGGLGAGAISLDRLSQTRNIREAITTEEKLTEEEEKAEVAPETIKPEIPPETEIVPISELAPEAARPEPAVAPPTEIPPETEAIPISEIAEEVETKPSSAREIQYWRKVIEQDPSKVSELKQYIQDLAFGREAGEAVDVYFDRINFGDFYRWAQQTIEEQERLQAEAEHAAKTMEETIKEPWKLTYDEYVKRINPDAEVDEWVAMVKKAIEEGKDVPWDVILSHPKLYEIEAPEMVETEEGFEVVATPEEEILGVKEIQEEAVLEEAKQAAPEEELVYEAPPEEMLTEAERDIQRVTEEQHKLLRKAILEMGGINDPHYEDIPSYLKRKETGRTLDDMVDELREVYGLPVHTADDLFELIQRMKAKQPLYYKGAPQKGEEVESIGSELPLILEEGTKERITKTQIVKWVQKTFQVPLRGKATEKWKSALKGKYYPREVLVRLRTWGDLATLAHEVAHHIDEMLYKQEGSDWLKAAPEEAKRELYKLDYSQRGNLQEGFAEYFRLLVSGLETNAPNFTKYFGRVLAKYPELRTNIAKMRKMYSIWSQQGAEARIAAQIDWRGEHQAETLKDKVARAVKLFQTRFIDEFYTIRKITEEVERRIGEKLPPSKNPYIMATYYKSKAGAIARTFVMEKAIDWTGKVVGPGLKEILEPIPYEQMPQFTIYLTALKAMNLEKRGITSGFNIEDIKYVIEKYKNPTWDKVAQQVTEWSDHLLDWLINAGSLDKSLAQVIRDLNPIYIPFKRVFIEGLRYPQGTGKGVDTGRGVKHLKGSGRPVINPLEALVTYATETISRAQKIHIARLFADLADQYGDIGEFVQRVPPPTKVFKVSAQEVAEALKAINPDIPAQVFDDLDGFLTFFTQDWQYNGKDYIVSIWRNGKRHFYEINRELYEALKGVEPLRLDPVVRLFAPFARIIRMGATGLRPSFAFGANPFRDALTYQLTTERPAALIYEPIIGAYKSIKAKPGEVIWRFKALGGSVSTQVGFDRASTMRTYDEVLLDKLGAKGKVLKVIKHPIDALSDIFSLTELGPRSVELEKRYKYYTSPEWKKEHPDWTEEDAFVQAFIDAQDVTINFSRSGSWGKVINQIIPFFNASIQGLDKTYRLFKEHPIRTTVRGLAYLSTLALWTWLQNRDKDWYKNLPPAYKYNNIFFEVGDTVIRLPIPFELGMVFIAAPQVALDMHRGDDKAIEGLIDIAKSQLPDVIPAVIKPIYDVMTNQDYLGNPIETEGMRYLYPTERVRYYTSKIARVLSKALDKLGIKVSPVQIDYLLTSYTGGFFREVKPPVSKELSEIPVISRFILRDKDYPRKQLNAFFSDWERLSQRKNADIATQEELRRYRVLQRVYNLYKRFRPIMVKAEQEGDKELLKKIYASLRSILARVGYE